ncbi:Kelch repeat-containing protein [Zhouia sp. PK063]|uniref:Kelch repeat-containing protein n=1 Tax=Zhouia sp. PK063 TaxID=3373602 RepID=UPI0037A1A264
MKKTRKPFIFFLKNIIPVALIAITFTSCSNSDDDDTIGNWITRSVFDGRPRSGSAAFTINNTGYVGTGYDGSDYLKDFWSFNIDGNYWEQKADFPGTARSSGVGFAVDGKGYIGSGYDGANELGDFFQYDPDTNTWKTIAAFPENARRGAVAFGINGFGYFGTGFDGDNDRKDFWKYDPTTDTWSQILGFGGDKRRYATTFTINNKVYLGTGVASGSYVKDFWVFDPSDESWTQLTDLDDDDDYNILRSNAVGFAIDNYGYIATGTYSGTTSSVWQYDPGTDTWEEKTGFEGVSRQDAIVISNGTQAFLGLGRSGTLYLDDFREFFPYQDYDDED